eukprot:gene10425-7267_t
MDLRKGCIFLKNRNRYIHILDGQRNPEKFFGEPTKKLSQRIVDTRTIFLRQASFNSFEEWPVVCLCDANICESYLFQASDSQNIPALTRRMKEQADIMNAGKKWWRLQCSLPESLALTKKTSISLDRHALSSDVLALESPHNRFLRFNGMAQRLYRFRVPSSPDTWSESWIPEVEEMKLNLPPQQSLGLQLLYASAIDVDFNAIIIIGSKSLCLQMNNWCSPLKRSLSASVTCELPNSNLGICWCGMSGHTWRNESSIPWVGIGTARTVYQYTLDKNDNWMRNKVFSFRSTPAVSLCAFHLFGPSCAPNVLACGMRNGTIQLLPLNESIRSAFDTTPRHPGTSVVGIHRSIMHPYELLSVSDNGAVKIWDLRHLSVNSGPVLKLNEVHSQWIGARSTSCNTVLAVASETTVSLFNTVLRNKVHEGPFPSTNGNISLQHVFLDYYLIIYIFDLHLMIRELEYELAEKQSDSIEIPTPFSSTELAIATTALRCSHVKGPSNIWLKLSTTLKSSTFSGVAVEFFEACIALVSQDCSSAEALLLLETDGAVIESIVHQTVEEYSDHLCCTALSNKKVIALCNLVILLGIILPETSYFSGQTILDLFENHTELAICILVHSFAKACGSRPGLSPMLGGGLQCRVASGIIKAIRSFTSWKLYEATHGRQTSKFSKTNCVPLSKLCGPYRHHVSCISTLMMKLPLFEELGVVYSLLRTTNSCQFHDVAKEAALLIESFMILTDQFTVQIRKYILHCRCIDRFLALYINDHSGETCRHSSVVYVTRALATLAMGSKGIQASIQENQKMLSPVVHLFSDVAFGSWRINLLFQLTRLIINGCVTSLVKQVVAIWNTLDARRKERLVASLCNSADRFAPLDTSARYSKLKEKILKNPSGNHTSTVHDSDKELTDLDIDDSESGDNIRDTEADLSEWRKGPPPMGIPLKYICSLTYRFIQSVPVLSPQGYIFDRTSILSYLEVHQKCPITGEPLLPDDLVVDEQIFFISCISYNPSLLIWLRYQSSSTDEAKDDRMDNLNAASIVVESTCVSFFHHILLLTSISARSYSEVYPSQKIITAMLRASLLSYNGIHCRTAPAKALVPPIFDCTSCFKKRSSWYLIKALAIIKLCSFSFIAENSVSHMKTAEKIFGTKLTYDICVKRTIYKLFCAGENDQELRNTISSLEENGIGAILDYAAEADTDGSLVPAPGAYEAPDISMSRLIEKCNVQYLMNEMDFENNMKLYMMSIMHAALHSPAGYKSLAAVKVTGMCDPQLLARMSAILMSIHQSWAVHFTQEEPPKLEECRIVMGPNLPHQEFISFEQFKEGFARLNPANPLTDEEINEVIKLLDSQNNGKISFVDYKDELSRAITATDPTPVQTLLSRHLPRLTNIEKELWGNLLRRLRLITSTAKELRVRVLVDAEQTFYQHAIDMIVFKLQKEFNHDKAVVYNTYQCYLTYAEDRVANDMARAVWHGYQWGGKIVRGAYMLQERATAKEYGYTSPIWPTYEETGECYMRSALRILAEIKKEDKSKFEVFFGTHNDVAVKKLAEEILQNPHIKDQVGFGQLYGMKDNLTIPLARANFPAYKYVPYGPVKETVHYIGRRAMENSSILTSDGSDERQLMKDELLRRIKQTMTAEKKNNTPTNNNNNRQTNKQQQQQKGKQTNKKR